MVNTESASAAVARIVDQLKDKPGGLLPILHAVQAALGYVPPAVLPTIAKALHLSRAEVYGVVSFYHQFRSSPPGRHVLQVCRAEACQAMGGRELADYARQRLGVEFGETTPDGAVTLRRLLSGQLRLLALGAHRRRHLCKSRCRPSRPIAGRTG